MDPSGKPRCNSVLITFKPACLKRLRNFVSPLLDASAGCLIVFASAHSSSRLWDWCRNKNLPYNAAISRIIIIVATEAEVIFDDDEPGFRRQNTLAAF